LITLDTSGLMALLNRRNPDHTRVCTAFDSDNRPYLVPAGILAEITYTVEQRLGPRPLNCQRLAAAAVERFGRIDILQNNVGIPSNQGLAEITEDAWDHLMTVNVRSMVLMAQAVVPHMVASGGGGSIINISSIAGLRAYPARSTAYTTSKAAVVGLTMALAGQLGEQHVRVNCIAPGQVFTPLVAERLDAEGRQRRATSGLIKDEGSAWDIGWAAVFLASDEARWVTGQVLTVDAGITITIPGNVYG